MSECKLCKERQLEINRILKAYKRDKKIGLWVVGILLAELILSLAYGKDGIIMLVDIIQGFLT